MEDIFNNIKKNHAVKLKKYLIVIVILCMPLFLTKGNPQESIQMILLLTIPSLLVYYKIFYHIYFYFKPEKSKIFKRFKSYSSKESICRYLTFQLENIVAEDGVVIVTPELLIDKNNYENILLLDDILSVHFKMTFYKGNEYYKIYVEYIDNKIYEIDYSNYPNTKKDVEKMTVLIRRKGRIL